MKKHTALKAAALVLALVVAPSAYAGETMSRDTGVGKEIAAQGNQALAAIKAELKARLLPAKPAVQKPRVVKMSQSAGSTVATGATVRCAE